jgi:hypothetical protein
MPDISQLINAPSSPTGRVSVTSALRGRVVVPNDFAGGGGGEVGPAGPPGPAGAVLVFEQPDAPTPDPAVGALWIDTDEPTPTAPAPGGGDAFAFFNG